MSEAEIYINFHKGKKAAVRVTNTKGTGDVVAQWAIADFTNGDEVVNGITIDRIIYSGEIKIYRSSAAAVSGVPTGGGLATGTSVTGTPEPAFLLNGDGDWDLASGGIPYHGGETETITVVIGPGDMCILSLNKNITTNSSYQGLNY